MKKFASMSVFVLLVGACGGGSNPADNPDGGGGKGADAAVDGSFTVQWGPKMIPAGQEDTLCVIKKLDNTGQLHIGAIHNVLGDVSHHFIVYRVADQPEQPDPFACSPFTDTIDPSKGSPLMITQKQEETLTLPQGVAFTLEPHQTIRLELHFINATDTDQMEQATSTFIPIADADFKDEADFLFIGNPDINLPPGQSSLGPTYFPLPSELAGSNFFALTGHEHQWGTSVSVATTTGSSGADTAVYDVPNFNWDEPATVYHDPPFQVPTGGGFRFTCDWDNQSGSNVKFGESVNDEMCFFWAYYYPSKGAKVCVHTDQVGSLDLCCPGNALCSQIFGN